MQWKSESNVLIFHALESRGGAPDFALNCTLELCFPTFAERSGLAPRFVRDAISAGRRNLVSPLRLSGFVTFIEKRQIRANPFRSPAIPVPRACRCDWHASCHMHGQDQIAMSMMFRLDYVSCLLTIVATVLVGRKMWTGFLVSAVNCVIVCVIGVHTSQYGFIPANLFCIGLYFFNIRSWRKEKKSFARVQSASIYRAVTAVLNWLRGSDAAAPRLEIANPRKSKARRGNRCYRVVAAPASSSRRRRSPSISWSGAMSCTDSSAPR
jgi:hypothetical protein